MSRLGPVVLAGVALSAACKMSGPAPRTGQIPPELRIEKFLQAPIRRVDGWRDFLGKVVVLEFWATYCVPCVDAIPHMNRLVERFSDRPVIFLTVTSEPEGVIRDFLAERPMKSWVALDPGKRVSSAFGVRSLPRLFVIDARGRVAGESYPGALDAASLEEALAGRALPEPSDADRNRAALRAMVGESEADALPAVLVRITPSRSSEAGAAKSGPGLFKQFAMPLEHLLVFAHGGIRGRIDFPSRRAQELYDVTLHAPGASDETMRGLAADAVQAFFPHSVRREPRVVDAYHLSRLPGRAPGLRPPAETDSMGGGGRKGSGKLEFKNAPLGWMTHSLERELGRPVVDKTGSRESYDYEILWKPGDRADLDAALARVGVRLASVKAPFEFLIVREMPR